MDLIPFSNLKVLHEPLLNNILDRLISIASHSTFIKGPEVKQFEDRFAELHGKDFFCVALANGTDALEIAARAITVKKMRALIPAMTCFAWAEALIHAGFELQFVDVCEK